MTMEGFVAGAVTVVIVGFLVAALYAGYRKSRR